MLRFKRTCKPHLKALTPFLPSWFPVVVKFLQCSHVELPHPRAALHPVLIRALHWLSLKGYNVEVVCSHWIWILTRASLKSISHARLNFQLKPQDLSKCREVSWIITSCAWQAIFVISIFVNFQNFVNYGISIVTALFSFVKNRIPNFSIVGPSCLLMVWDYPLVLLLKSSMFALQLHFFCFTSSPLFQSTMTALVPNPSKCRWKLINFWSRDRRGTTEREKHLKLRQTRKGG